MSNHDNPQGVGDAAFGWPGQNPQADADVDGMAHSRPTSPATGAAAAAAARAAYAGADKTSGLDAPVDASADAPDTGEGASVAADNDGGLPEEAVQGDLAGDAPQADATSAPQTSASQMSAPQAGASDAERLAAERLADYQRLNAEYINYKRRVDRDRAEDRTRATAGVVESLLPVLDEIYFARQHGEVGETFDPAVHEALMHTTADLPPGTSDTTVVMVMQPGYRMGERVVRPARVSVADPA